MFFAKKKELVGVDVGSSSIKLVQLKETKLGYEVVNIGVHPLPPEAIVDNSLMDSSAIVEAIRALFKTLEIDDVREAATSVSGNSVIIRKIGLPVMPPEELEDQIQWEAEQYIPFDVNDVNIDFQLLDTDEQDASRMNVLLVASKKEIVNDYLSVFNEAGIKLVVVDVDAFAVQNAFELNYDVDSNNVCALINIGANIMNLNVVKDGVSLFTRDVQMGGNLYTEEIQKKMAVSGEEAERLKIAAGHSRQAEIDEAIEKVNETLSMEIRRSLDFYNANALEGKINRLFLSGGGAKIPGLGAAVEQRLGLPVEIINPLQKMKWSDKRFEAAFVREIAPLLTVAVGLAARRLGDK